MGLRSDAYFFANATGLSRYRRLDEGHESGYLAKLLVNWIKSSGSNVEGYVLGAGKAPQTYVVKMIYHTHHSSSRIWLQDFMDYLDAIDLEDWYQFVEIYEHPDFENDAIAIERGLLHSYGSATWPIPNLSEAYEQKIDGVIGSLMQHKIQ